VRERLNLIKKAVNRLAAALLRMELEVRLQDDVRVFVPQPVKPVVGKIEIKDVLAGNAALDQLPDTLTQQGGLAASPDAGDHRDLIWQAANGDTPGQQSVRRLKVLVFADDSFQAFDHDMVRCSQLVLATGAIDAWRAGKSKWFVETAVDSVRFRFREPNRRPKWLPGSIKLCGKRARMIHRRKLCLRRFPLIPGDDTAEPLLPFDWTGRCAPEIGGDDVVTGALVGPLGVVVIEPDAVDVGQLAKTKADEVVQALMLAGTDEGFAKSVGLRRFRRNADAAHPGPFPEGVELLGELGVAVVDQVPGVDAVVVEPHGRIPRLLHHPGLVGMKGRLTHVDPAAAQMQEDQHVGVELAAQGIDLLGEEVAGHQRFHVGADELRPGNGGLALGLLGRWRTIGSFQDVADGGQPHGNPEFLELAEDALVAPGEILGRHAQDHRDDILGGAGSSGRFRTAGFGFRTQPAAVGLRLDHQHDIGDVVVDLISQPQELGPLLRGGNNTLVVDPVTQHPDLKHQQLHPDVVFRQEPMRQKGENYEQKIEFHAQPTILRRMHILLISI